MQGHLIDIQDVLSMAREELGHHNYVLGNGELLLREHEDKIEMLNMELDDFEQKIVLMKKKVS
jgi:hypothetical protein